MTLDRRILDIRLVAMLIIFLVASVALIPTWSPTQAQASTSAPCKGCSDDTPKGYRPLKGAEREAAIAKMLNSKDYKKVEKLLVDAGYKPLIEYAAAVNTTYVIGVGVAFATSNGTLITSDGAIAGVAFIATSTYVQAQGFIFNTVSREFILKVESASKEPRPSSTTSSQECTSDQECQELWGYPTCRCVATTCEVLNNERYDDCIDDCDDDRDGCLGTVALVCAAVCVEFPPACAACVAAAILGCWWYWDICRQQCLLTWCLDWYHDCQC